MHEIRNDTPFEAALAPGLGMDDRDHAVVVVKGTFVLKNGSDDLEAAEEQVPVFLVDEHYGEPAVSSIKYEMDTCLTKPTTDVVLNGAARPKRPVVNLDVGLKVGKVSKVVRVFGDRHWHRKLGVWKATAPRPFKEMPLVWERAFGGIDDTHSKEKKHRQEERNPIGTGFAARRGSDRLDGLALPNLERPLDLISRWNSHPAPTGFGFTGRHWAPRAAFGGTCDETWQDERCPLLPLDFDTRYFNGAAPGLIAKKHLQGGEEVRIINMSPDGEIRCALPKRRPTISLNIQGERVEADPRLDTVIIEPDENQLIMVWRGTVPCPRKFMYIESVDVGEMT